MIGVCVQCGSDIEVPDKHWRKCAACKRKTARAIERRKQQRHPERFRLKWRRKARRRYLRDPERERRKARRWRTNNPEHYAQYLARAKLKYQEKIADRISYCQQCNRELGHVHGKIKFCGNCRKLRDRAVHRAARSRWEHLQSIKRQQQPCLNNCGRERGKGIKYCTECAERLERRNKILRCQTINYKIKKALSGQTRRVRMRAAAEALKDFFPEAMKEVLDKVRTIAKNNHQVWYIYRKAALELMEEFDAQR